MECSSFLDGLLVADAAELRGEPDTPLARHVRSCATCRAAAHAILHGQTVLAWHMDDAARAPAGKARRAGGLRTMARVALPAAAVLAFAVLAADRIRLLADRTDANTTTGSTASPAPAVADGAHTVVDVAPGQNAVVFNTSNPGITVVWYYEEEG